MPTSPVGASMVTKGPLALLCQGSCSLAITGLTTNLAIRILTYARRASESRRRVKELLSIRNRADRRCEAPPIRGGRRCTRLILLNDGGLPGLFERLARRPVCFVTGSQPPEFVLGVHDECQFPVLAFQRQQQVGSAVRGCEPDGPPEAVVLDSLRGSEARIAGAEVGDGQWSSGRRWERSRGCRRNGRRGLYRRAGGDPFDECVVEE
jgi:hypothetical protein